MLDLVACWHDFGGSAGMKWLTAGMRWHEMGQKSAFQSVIKGHATKCHQMPLFLKHFLSFALLDLKKA